MTYIHRISPITERDVRTALSGLLYKVSAHRWPNPLLDLRLIDHLCATPEFPDTPLKRQLALADILTTVIEEGYTHHRRVQSLEPPLRNTPQIQVLSQITQDASAQSLELLVWSWLYHRYVRIDLGITPGQFAVVCCIHERTLRRYMVHGVRRMTERLVFLEQQVRGEAAS